jgi:NhaC family Na+:H+ antiporter
MQHNAIIDTIKYAVMGYTMDKASPLYSIIKGGGLISMVKVSVVVIISSAFSGIFEGTGMLNSLDSLISRANSRFELFIASIIVSTVSAAFGCTQAIAIILTDQLLKKTYKDKGASNSDLAVDIENTAVLISPAIPWNIAGLTPASVLSVGIGFIPFAFYLYIVPIFNLIQLKIKEMRAI